MAATPCPFRALDGVDNVGAMASVTGMRCIAQRACDILRKQNAHMRQKHHTTSKNYGHITAHTKNMANATAQQLNRDH